MIRCPRRLALVIVLVSALPVTAQRRSPTPSLPGGAPGISGTGIPQYSELVVHVVLSSGHPIPDLRARVQVVNAGGVPVREGFSDSSGEARLSGLSPGSYRVHVSGIGIEDTTTETFEVEPREMSHIEYVQVRLKSAAGGPMSTQGTVSAQSLKVPDKARHELERGNEAIRKKDLDAAEEHYRKAIEHFPQYAAAYNNLGLVCMERKNFACGRDAFEKAVAADSSLADGYINLARLRLVEQNPNAAYLLLQHALSLQPLHPRALLLMAQAEIAEGKFDDAVGHARKLETASPGGVPVAHFIAAKALEGERKFAEAAVEYETFLKQAPENPAAPQARAALAHLQSGTTQGQPPRQP